MTCPYRTTNPTYPLYRLGIFHDLKPRSYGCEIKSNQIFKPKVNSEGGKSDQTCAAVLKHVNPLGLHQGMCNPLYCNAIQLQISPFLFFCLPFLIKPSSQSPESALSLRQSNLRGVHGSWRSGAGVWISEQSVKQNLSVTTLICPSSSPAFKMFSLRSAVNLSSAFQSSRNLLPILKYIPVWTEIYCSLVFQET